MDATVEDDGVSDLTLVWSASGAYGVSFEPNEFVADPIVTLTNDFTDFPVVEPGFEDPVLTDGQFTYLLEPAKVLCLSEHSDDLKILERTINDNRCFFLIAEKVKRQCLRAKVLDVFSFYNEVSNIENFDVDKACCELEKDPVEFCRKQNPVSRESRVITWTWPRDAYSGGRGTRRTGSCWVGGRWRPQRRHLLRWFPSAEGLL